MNQSTTTWQPNLYNEKYSFVYQYGEGLIDVLVPKENERILDLGCGSGQLTAKISEITKNVTGIDSSADMIADAKAKYSHIDFEVADASDFHFAEKFDAVFSNAVLHWVKDYRGAIRCMYENLKPGGRMVVEFGGKGNIQTIVHALRKVLTSKGYQQQAALELWYFPSIGEYTPLLEEQGFRVHLAQHFDRPTELADAQTGIIDWLTMFGEPFFKGVASVDIEAIKQEVQDNIQAEAFRNGKWYADYVRLRIVATR